MDGPGPREPVRSRLPSGAEHTAERSAWRDCIKTRYAFPRATKCHDDGISRGGRVYMTGERGKPRLPVTAAPQIRLALPEHRCRPVERALLRSLPRQVGCTEETTRVYSRCRSGTRDV